MSRCCESIPITVWLLFPERYEPACINIECPGWSARVTDVSCRKDTSLRVLDRKRTHKCVLESGQMQSCQTAKKQSRLTSLGKVT